MIDNLINIEAFNRTSLLGNFCKLGVNVINLTSQFTTTLPLPIITIRNQLKVTSEVFGAIGCVSHIRDWICPEREGVKGKEKPFWLNPSTSKVKIIGKALLTASSVCDALKFLNQVNIVSLGIFSVKCGGILFFRFAAPLPVMTLVKMGLIILSGKAGVVDNYLKFKQTAKKEKEIEEKLTLLFGRFKEGGTFPSQKKVYKFELLHANNQLQKNKLLLSTACEVAKIAGVSFALLMMALGIQTGVGMCLSLSMGILGSCMGLYKYHYEQRHQPLPTPLFVHV